MKAPHRHFFDRFGAIISLARRAYYPYRWQILGLTLLSFVGGILEGIGINAVIPLFSYLVDASGPASDTVTNVMRSLFQVLHLDFSPKYLLFFIVAMFMARGVAMFCIAYVQALIASDYGRETKRRLFGSLLHSSWPHLVKHKLGHLESILMVDVHAGESLLRHLGTSITLLTGIIVYLAVAFTISPIITGITLLLGLIVIFGSKPLLYRIRMLGIERVSINQGISHLVSENTLGLKTVKAAGVEDKLLARGADLFNRYRAMFIKMTLLQQMTQFLIPPLGVLYIALIFGVAYRTEFVSIAVLPAIFYLIYRIFLYVQQVQDSIQRVNDLVPHLQSVLAVIDAAERAQERSSGNRPFSFLKELSFKSVEYHYEDAEHSALSDVSFTIPRGGMIGLIGPSGSGKTTCVDLMLRLLENTGGSITLDDVDIRTISLEEWRGKTAYVSQDIFLTHDTIANNIRFYNEDLSIEEIAKAARMAHLDDVVAAHRDGLNVMVGERGMKLSAGQRQRIAIARALARKPELLILDEATSALDAESEAYIKRILEELKGSITIIVIAHRLSTIMNADMLIALENGRIVEADAPEKLLKEKDSYFYRVNSIQ